MRRVPFFFGTPPKPPSHAIGSLAPYHHEDAQFPALGSPSMLSRPPLDYKTAATHGLTTSASSSSLFRTSLPTVVETRRDRQFTQQCNTLDAKLEASQHSAAKTILSTLPASEHKAWLKKLQQSLQTNTPMTTNAPTVKTYYKRHFKPYFIAPVPLTYATPSTTTVTAGQKDTHSSNYWDDLARAIYGEKCHRCQAQPVSRKRIVRPSSQVHYRYPSAPDIDEVATARSPAEPSHDTLLRDECLSKHSFQYVSYDVQHTAYLRKLLPDTTPKDSLSYLLDTTQAAAMDLKGRRASQHTAMWTRLEQSMKRDLSTTPIQQWFQLLQQYSALCEALNTKSEPTKTRLVSNHDSEFTATSNRHKPFIGTGVNHFPPSHRLRKRAQRAERFVHSLLLQQTSFECAPPLRQHLINPIFSPPAVILPPENSSALIFQQHSFPFCSFRPRSFWDSDAPILRQHFPQTFATRIPIFDFRTPLQLSDTIAPIFRSHCQLTFSPFRTSFSCVGVFDVWRLGVSDQPLYIHNAFCDHFGSSISQFGSTLHSLHQEYMGIHWTDYDGIFRRDLFPHTPAIQTHLRTIERALVFCQHHKNQQEESRTDLTRAQPIKAGQLLLMTDPTSEVSTLAYRPFGPPLGRLFLSSSHGCASTSPSSTLWTPGLASLPTQHYCPPSPLDEYEAFLDTRTAQLSTNEDSTISILCASLLYDPSSSSDVLAEHGTLLNADTAPFFSGSNMSPRTSSSSDESLVSRPRFVQDSLSPFSLFDQQQQSPIQLFTPPGKTLTYEGYSSFKSTLCSSSFLFQMPLFVNI